MMKLFENPIWISDLDETIMSMPELGKFSGKTILITGCNGLICSAVVDLLGRWNEKHSDKIGIIAAGRNYTKIKERFSQFADEEWFSIESYDACSYENCIESQCDYIIHGASNASPNKIIKEPVETMLSNFIGTLYLLNYAKAESVKRVLFISSSEVYGKKEGSNPYRTAEYGYIDLLNPRNSYSVSKRAAETLCCSYAAEYGVESVIIRPGHIYGPTAVESDNRVSSAWAYEAASGKNIIMKSDGSQIRSYCYCLDSATAILKVLLEGEPMHAYNISNPESIISIKEMAEILTKTVGVELQLEIPSEDEKRGFNPMSNSSLDSEELLKLGWKGLFNAERGLSHTVKIIREIIQ